MNPHIGVELDVYLMQNKKLVYDTVRKKFHYVPKKYGIPFDDLHQLGMIGFIKAYDIYNPTLSKLGKPVKKFSTIAVPYIQGEIFNYLRDYSIGPKFGRTARDVAALMRRKQIGHWRDAHEVAAFLNVPLHHAKDAIECLIYTDTVSFEKELNDTEGYATLYFKDVIGEVDLTEQMTVLKLFIESLLEIEQTILLMYADKYTQAEIGKVVGLAQVSVSRTLKKIREEYLVYSEGIEGNGATIRSTLCLSGGR